jgi:hypothetical protein
VKAGGVEISNHNQTVAPGPEVTRGAKARSMIRRRLPVIIATVCALMATLLLAPRSYVGGATGGHAATGSASIFDKCQQISDQIALLEAEKADLQEQLKEATGNQKIQLLAQIKKLLGEITELKSQLLACQCPKTPPATDTLLELTGSSTLTNVDATSAETFSLTLNLKNLTPSPVTITRAELFVADAGGWAYSWGELIAKGNFLGVSPTLPGNANYPNMMFSWSWSTPVKYVIFVIEATSGAQSQELITQIPINRPGYANVAPLPAERRFFIGLQEPLEIITLADGKRWLTVIGQVINGTGEPAALRSWKLSLRNTQNTLIWIESEQKFFDADLKPNSFDGSASLNRFLYAFEVPDNFAAGELTVESSVAIGASCQSVIRKAGVNIGPNRDRLQPPVKGIWNWGNGPGGTSFNAHNPSSGARYAYDLGMLQEVNGKLQTFKGDPAVNESYFCWDQPIYCVEEGWVVAIDDTIEDNSGNQGVDKNPANPKQKNSYVVVGHGQFRNYDRYSIYAHVRKGSAKVIPDQHVFAGDELAKVGNAGQSSEPHLHFHYYTIDSTGHPRALPMRFNNLYKYAPGDPNNWLTDGVPIGNRQYLTK